MEQTLLTDQDNALVYADEGAAHAGVVPGARRAGERGPRGGGLPARAPAATWRSAGTRRSRSGRERFRGWIDAPSPQALLEAAIFFDFRRVAGGLSTGAARRRARGGGGPSRVPALPRAVGARLPAAADAPAPAQGGSSVVDLKAHGISPIVFLARCYGLEAGTRARGTLERLDAAARAALVDEDVGTRVAEAFRFSSVFACGCSSAASRRASRSRTPSRSPSSPRSSARSSRTRCGR